MAMRPLEELIQELPPDLRAEVSDFVEFLLAKRARSSDRRLRQDWADALKGADVSMSAVDLQHRASEWRTE